MAYGIRLQIQKQRYYLLNHHVGFRARIEVIETNGDIDPKIFAYLAEPITHDSDELRGMFDHVCSISDIETYPEDEPLLNDSPPFFRLNYIDIVEISQETVEELISDVKDEVLRLKETYDVMETLDTSEDIWIGDAPASSSSSSSSSV